jgi:hypothetical protein
MHETSSRSDEQTSENREHRLEGWYVASAEATPAPYEDEDDPGKALSLYRRILDRFPKPAAPASR